MVVYKITSEMKEMEFSYWRERKDPQNGNNKLTFIGIFFLVSKLIYVSPKSYGGPHVTD